MVYTSKITKKVVLTRYLYIYLYLSVLISCNISHMIIMTALKKLDSFLTPFGVMCGFAEMVL